MKRENIKTDAVKPRTTKIIATIKEHSTYCGINQTILTRGKVLEREGK